MLPRPMISGPAPTRPSASRSLLTRGSHDHDCVPALRFASKPTLSSPTSCHFSLFRELEPCYNEQAVTIKGAAHSATRAKESPSSHIGIIRWFRGSRERVPLPPRYLRTGR